MSKNFRVKGRIMKKHFFEPLTFNTVVKAAKEAHAVERIYAEMGSRHRAKRNEVKIESISEEQVE